MGLYKVFPLLLALRSYISDSHLHLQNKGESVGEISSNWTRLVRSISDITKHGLTSHTEQGKGSVLYTVSYSHIGLEGLAAAKSHALIFLKLS